MPEQFENGWNSLQDFDAIERYLSISLSVYTMPFPMCRLEFNFQTLPFSKCAGKMCRFRVNKRPIRNITSKCADTCERGLTANYPKFLSSTLIKRKI